MKIWQLYTKPTHYSSKPFSRILYLFEVQQIYPFLNENPEHHLLIASIISCSSLPVGSPSLVLETPSSSTDCKISLAYHGVIWDCQILPPSMTRSYFSQIFFWNLLRAFASVHIFPHEISGLLVSQGSPSYSFQLEQLFTFAFPFFKHLEQTRVIKDLQFFYIKHLIHISL